MAFRAVTAKHPVRRHASDIETAAHFIFCQSVQKSLPESWAPIALKRQQAPEYAGQGLWRVSATGMRNR